MRFGNLDKELGSVFTDIKNASKIFKDMREARKEGYEVEIRQAIQVPVYAVGLGFLDTVEGCTLINSSQITYEQVHEIFRSFSVEEKRMLSFAPKDGEFIDRMNFWREKLQYAMPDKRYRLAIMEILRWYIHIKLQRKELRKL